jgi:hypothetical protein
MQCFGGTLCSRAACCCATIERKLEALTGSNTKPSGATNPAPDNEAPVGHRQPRAGDVPSEKNLSDPLSRENGALDKKIKSICRGC